MSVRAGKGGDGRQAYYMLCVMGVPNTTKKFLKILIFMVRSDADLMPVSNIFKILSLYGAVVLCIEEKMAVHFFPVLACDDCASAGTIPNGSQPDGNQRTVPASGCD